MSWELPDFLEAGSLEICRKHRECAGSRFRFLGLCVSFILSAGHGLSVMMTACCACL